MYVNGRTVLTSIKPGQAYSNIFGAANEGFASVGDIDGDGVDDAVSCAKWTGTPSLMFMNATGGPKAQHLLLWDQELSQRMDWSGSRYGWSAAGAGDLDGDGIPDIAIGSPEYDGASWKIGAIYVLHMRRDGSIRNATRVSYPPGQLSEGDRIGRSVVLL